MRYFGCTAVVLNLALGFSLAFAEVEHSVSLGRLIYEQGVGRDAREIAAKLHGSVSMTGAAVACAGCHGKDGRGGGEAFIRAPDIRWGNLNQPFPARRAGTAEASYDRSTFKKALLAGVSAAGRKLDPVMPRFELADDEIDALIAYLSKIDTLLNDKQEWPVIFGLLPTPGKNLLTEALDTKLKNCPAAESGSPVATINMLYFDSPDAAIAQLKEQLRENMQAIILAPYLIGWEDRYVDTMRDLKVKTVLPFTFLNQISGVGEVDWNFPFPGLEAQILALLKSMQANGHHHLHIAYDPKDLLSSRLNVFTTEVAVKRGITLVEDQLEESIDSTRYVILWLKKIPKDLSVVELDVQPMMLAPVLFFSQDLITTLQATEWRVAYPYRPKSEDNSTWRAPVNAWAQAACSFLAQTGAEKIKLTMLPEVLLWETNAHLYQKPSLDELSEQVIVEIFVSPDQY